MVSRVPISAMLRYARPILRKRLCVTVNPYAMDAQLMDRPKKDRIVERTFYSPYCTAENYPFAPAQMLVDAANKKQNHLNQLTAFKRYTQYGQNLLISCHRVSELNRATISWALQLTRDNMHLLYEQSEWGWSEKIKMEELTNKKAWYLIVRTPEGHNVAFVHFRFDLDYGVEVLYCYEIQLDKAFRRVGLGHYLMLILELIAKQNRMKKVMLTVFKHNVVGRSFFAKKLRYEVDETSPSCRRTSYEILSKKIIYRPAQSRSKQLSRQAASSCLRIRMPYSLERPNQSSVESMADLPVPPREGRQFEAPKIKAKVTHSTTCEQLRHQTLDHTTVSQPNLENTNKILDFNNTVLSSQPIKPEPYLETAMDFVDSSLSELNTEDNTISLSKQDLMEPNLQFAAPESEERNVQSELLEPNLGCVTELKNESDVEIKDEPEAKFIHNLEVNNEIDAEIEPDVYDSSSDTKLEDLPEFTDQIPDYLVQDDEVKSETDILANLEHLENPQLPKPLK